MRQGNGIKVLLVSTLWGRLIQLLFLLFFERISVKCLRSHFVSLDTTNKKHCSDKTKRNNTAIFPKVIPLALSVEPTSRWQGDSEINEHMSPTQKSHPIPFLSSFIQNSECYTYGMHMKVRAWYLTLCCIYHYISNGTSRFESLLPVAYHSLPDKSHIYIEGGSQWLLRTPARTVNSFLLVLLTSRRRIPSGRSCQIKIPGATGTQLGLP